MENKITMASKSTLNIRELLRAEAKTLQERRNAKGIDTNLEDDSLGIALSGGGIRSATICLGIVEKLHKIGLLEKTDYLSSVSGGGYLAAYIHSVLNGENARNHKDLFAEKDIAHLMNFRRYLLLFPNRTLGRVVSYIVLLLVAIIAVLLNSMWFILPILYYYFCDVMPMTAEFSFWIHALIMLALGGLAGMLFSPNFTSPHRFYKSRLRKAYLWQNKDISLQDLSNKKAPYPLLNAAVHVNYDNYDKTDIITYRGRIKSNYFLFSPQFCGSQVTGYVPTNSMHYKNMELATAMAVSAAAVNTFMGNFRLPLPIRVLMGMANLRTGILAPNPQLKQRRLTWWPKYTFLELLGKANTTTHRIQVSDGGHIENLAIYELLRRKVKTIIAIDAGEDKNFNFSDLRNLLIRARNELGIVIEFDQNADPLDIIQPNLTTGFSKNHFVVARIRGLKGSYAEDYNGVLIYIKSTLLPSDKFSLRVQKNKVKRLNKLLKKEKKNAELLQQLKEEKDVLDRDMYQTYTPAFPHQSTSDQFFDEAQWSAYHHLGQAIGEHFIKDIGFEEVDSNLDFFQKSKAYFDRI